MKGFNFQQLFIMLLGIAAVVLIGLKTPHYKIVEIDSRNFIITEESSSLYKRSKGKIGYHWDKIALYSSGAIVLCGIGIFLTRTKNR